MDKYWAKSDGETIIEHTQNLLKNLTILRKVYPETRVNWKLLELACIFHDLGKINAKFQKKIRENRSFIPGEIPHGLLSVSLLPAKKLVKEDNFTIEDVRVLCYTIANHHERNFSEIEKKNYQVEVEKLNQELPFFNYASLSSLDLKAKVLSGKYYQLKDKFYLEKGKEKQYFQYVMLKGLLNRIDYAASAHELVEYENNFLEDAMKNLDYQWNPLQQYMQAHQKDNVVIVAQTGMGKTEAGLLWLGNSKGFFTLPLKAAINAIYARIYRNIVTEKQDHRVGLLHSDTFSQYLALEETDKELKIEEYETRTKQLSLPLTICTLDQLFDFVFRYAGYEPKLATLSYSKVIIDEIQMYSASLLAYLILGLKYITEYGGKFAILTATLPPFILHFMEEKGISFKMPDTPFVDEELSLRHSVKVIHEEINAQFVKEQYHQNKILVICNTVKNAKKIFSVLQEEGIEVNMLHSQFIQKDRRAKEEAIQKFVEKGNKESGIWVATQVVEASLDIDFDLLITELSDLSGLFQRMGRCYRKRPWEESVATNVFVFDKSCSGIGHVVDKGIHELSKEALSYVDGPLTEMVKIKLIEENFTFEKMEKTDYYKEVKNNLNYLTVVDPNDFDKSMVKKIFRNITNVSVIPKPVYVESELEIKEYIESIQKKATKEMIEEEKRLLKREKRRARDQLNRFRVDIPRYLIEGKDVHLEPIQISKYEQVQILDCTYDKKNGIGELKKEDQFF